VEADQYDKLAAYQLMRMMDFETPNVRSDVIDRYNRALAVSLQQRGIENIGSITSPEGQVLAFETGIDPLSMDVYSALKTKPIWPQIARYVEGRPPEGETPANPAARYNRQIVMPFSPYEARARAVDESGTRHATNVSRDHIIISLGGMECTIEQSRFDYDRDIWGTLNQVHRMMARADIKSPDQQLATLLRNGHTADAWHTKKTGKAFFDTDVPCDFGTDTARGAKFTNYRTGTPLTTANLSTVCESMINIKGPDGITLNLGAGDGSMQSGFQLVVPTTLLHKALEAVFAEYIVRSGTNPAPGQASNTAAQGMNPFMLMKYVREIVVLPELTDSGADEDTTNWYVQAIDTGPWALLYSLGSNPEYVSAIAPDNYNTFWAFKYVWGWFKYEGVGYGHPQWITKCKAS
jgi:hypothetical protein